MNYQDENARAIDRWVEQGWEWGVPVTHEAYAAAQRGAWDLLLTPTKPVPHAWFGELKGKKVLGLASGGGQQIPILTALGAECTVLDYSEKQLGGQLEAGFRLTDLYEDTNGSGRLHEMGIPCFIAVRAVKPL